MRSTIVLLTLVVLLPGTVVCANVWDEILDGSLPLVSPYYYESEGSGSTLGSVDIGSGNLALDLKDQSTSLKGRVNRGNWSTVLGCTLYTRFQIVSANTANVMGLQLTDGVAAARIRMQWSNGILTIDRGTADSGWPSTISAPAGTWVSMWVKITTDKRFEVFLGDALALYTKGNADPSGGVVYFGNNSTTGTGEMLVDFWYVENTGAYAPNDLGAPVVPEPSSLLALVTGLGSLGTLALRRRH